MRIMASVKHGSQIVLIEEEKKTLRKAKWLLSTLSKHVGGDDEKAAAEAVAKVADKWAPEEDEKKEAKK